MKKWKLIGGIVLVFVLGGLAGSFGTHLYSKHRFERFRKDPAERRAFFLKKLTDDLRLTDSQQRDFRAIIEETDTQVHAAFQEHRREIDALMEKGFSLMKGKLDPAQQKSLAELRRKFEERRKRLHGGRPPGGGPP
ncbi:MAG: Spy/CpxP family protein refolding chaperone [Deltaproteobacteria bacterium]|nr:Spy/CpxP family protein refolding chaperone [Deltaproteobacteria bacterium]